MVTIANDRLTPGPMTSGAIVKPFVPSPNIGGPLVARFLVIHYTAGPTADGAIRWFQDPQAKASAHVVIDTNGDATQMVAFTQVAWHAGQSEWLGLSGLNRHAIGIELANCGRLNRRGNDWVSWSGTVVPGDEVIEAQHKHGGPVSGWQVYPKLQIDAALEIGRALVDAYGLADTIGHDDIAPGRKSDPGPAFPMISYQSALIGRRDDQPSVLKVTERLNIRTGPGSQNALVPGGPLAAGTRVIVKSASGDWRNVDAVAVDGASIALSGWVHGRYLAPA